MTTEQMAGFLDELSARYMECNNKDTILAIARRLRLLGTLADAVNVWCLVSIEEARAALDADERGGKAT